MTPCALPQVSAVMHPQQAPSDDYYYQHSVMLQGQVGRHGQRSVKWVVLVMDATVEAEDFKPPLASYVTC